MKIAIPVELKTSTSEISQVFGRAPYFLIYNKETNGTIFVSNPAMNSQGGAGIRAAQFIVDNQIDVLLCQRLGENSAKLLKKAKIKIYKSIQDLASNNLVAFTEGKLSILDEIHAGYHTHEK